MLCFGTNSGCCDLAVATYAAQRIRWDLLSLECVWREDSNGIGAHQPLNTGDEMLFDPRDLTLQAIRIKVPEFNANPACDAWGAVQQESGIPRLRSPSSFEPRLMQVRHYDGQNDVLTVLAMLTSEGKKRRISVDSSLSILALGTEAIGWRLERASTFIASPVDDTIPSKPGNGSESERKLLGLFLATVDDAFVERMEEQDPTARDALTTLMRECGGQDNAVSEVLEGWIPDILSRFY